MRLPRTDVVPLLTIVAGGLVGGSLSFSLLGSGSDDMPAPVPVIAPALTLEDRFEAEIRKSLRNRYEEQQRRLLERDRLERVEEAIERANIQEIEYTYSRMIRDKIFVLPGDVYSQERIIQVR